VITIYYDPTKGIFGNIEEALKQNQHRKNEIYNECNTRKSADDANENAVCELDESYDQRIADIENALCELDR